MRFQWALLRLIRAPDKECKSRRSLVYVLTKFTVVTTANESQPPDLLNVK